jgi:hypothetical protein
MQRILILWSFLFAAGIIVACGAFAPPPTANSGVIGVKAQTEGGSYKESTNSKHRTNKI